MEGLKKEIIYGGFKLTICDNNLTEVACMSDQKELFLPSILPTGDVIKKIYGMSFSPSACKLKRLIISDDISCIGDNAFMRANISEIVWPSSCKTIPNLCFLGSQIESVKNIDCVEIVGASAFADTPRLHSLDWPSSCKVIPTCCFSHSGITHINNLRHITNIRDFAFANSSLTELDLSSSALSVIDEYGLSEINEEIIKVPYYWQS